MPASWPFVSRWVFVHWVKRKQASAATTSGCGGGGVVPG